MAPHSSTLAWKIPGMGEPGGLSSMGSLRVGHDWATSLSLFTFMHWRRKWQPTPVFLPGEPQGRRSLVGCRLWGCTVGHDWSDSEAAAAADCVSSFPCIWFFLLDFLRHLCCFFHVLLRLFIGIFTCVCKTCLSSDWSLFLKCIFWRGWTKHLINDSSKYKESKNP